MNERQRESRAVQKSPFRVIEFSRKECPFSNRDYTWQQFHTFRNEVVDILSPYGSVGPSGKMPILDTFEESLDALRSQWRSMPKDSQVGNSKPDFFVVDDDLYGMSVRVEAAYTLAKPVLLEELGMLLKPKQFQEWCVYLALIKGACSYFMTGSSSKEISLPAAPPSKTGINAVL
jgi:hypothetical protein